MPDILNNN